MAILQAERDILKKINDYRKEHHLTSYNYDDFMSTLARYHSQNMADGKIPFSHDNVRQRLNTTASHYKNLQYLGGSENVYMGCPDWGNPIESWSQSESHNKNLLFDYTKCGVGCAVNKKNQHYVTALFAHFKTK